jgi:hypothetical protein
MLLESVRLDEVEERVYNFHVAELQNYAVGECGVLVHNINDPPEPARRPDGKNVFDNVRDLQWQRQRWENLFDDLFKRNPNHPNIGRCIEMMNQLDEMIVEELAKLDLGKFIPKPPQAQGIKPNNLNLGIPNKGNQ